MCFRFLFPIENPIAICSIPINRSHEIVHRGSAQKLLQNQRMNTEKSRRILTQASKIAIVRTDRLGDMVLTLPLASALKSEYPNAEICMVARRYVGPLVENCPAVDRAIYIDDFGSIAEIFRKEKFSAVFFPRPRLGECAAAFFARAPLRVGTAYRYYSFFFNHRVRDHRKNAEHHEAEYNARLLESVVSKSYDVALTPPFVEPEALSAAIRMLESHGIPPETEFIIIHPGSGGSARDLPAKSFREAAELISRRSAVRIVVTGSESESEQCNEVASAGSFCCNLCGELSLPELISLTSIARLLVANSTGILHIAAALGVPVVGLYPNSPHLSARRWGPFTPKKIILTPPSTGEDIDDVSQISPALVSEAVLGLLAR